MTSSWKQSKQFKVYSLSLTLKCVQQAVLMKLNGAKHSQRPLWAFEERNYLLDRRRFQIFLTFTKVSTEVQLATSFLEAEPWQFLSYVIIFLVIMHLL